MPVFSAGLIVVLVEERINVYIAHTKVGAVP